MKKQILLICALTLLFGNMATAQGNWVAADQSVSPSAVLASSGTVTAMGSYTWNSATTYRNDNHRATLTFALPPSVYSATGVPSLTFSNNNAPVQGATFALTGRGWTATFAPNTDFVSGTKLIFSINNLDIKDDQNYTDQKLSHFITFLSSPADEILADNAATSSFQTTVAGPLPVGLLDFDAKLLDRGINAKVDLTWTTTLEINADRFIIERSKNATDWEEYTSVKAKGNSNTNLDYQTFDTEPFTGRSYYRLKQMDIDNSFSYSNVRSVNNGTSTDINVFPNPATDEVNVQYTLEREAMIEVKLLTMQGRVAKSLTLKSTKGTHVAKMNVIELANGLYELSVYQNSKLINTTKIHKN